MIQKCRFLGSHASLSNSFEISKLDPLNQCKVGSDKCGCPLGYHNGDYDRAYAVLKCQSECL